MISQYSFSLKITNQEYLSYYSGDANSVQVRTDHGLVIQFPASALKPHITHYGIDGKFVIKFDQNNKLIALDKISRC